MTEQVHYKAGKKIECKTLVYVITLITVLIFAPPSATYCPLYDTGTILDFYQRHSAFKLTLRVG